MELAGYSSTFVAQHFGAGDMQGCSRSTSQGIFIALLSWPLIILLIPLGEWVLTLSGHEARVLDEELIYFRVLMLGGVVSPLGVAAAGFFTGRGQTLVTMAAAIVTNAANIGLDYLLIFGGWGIPAMGIKGAAIATVIAGLLNPLILLTIFFSKRVNDRFQSRAAFRFNPSLAWRMLRFGTPSSVHLTLDVASFSLFVLFTGADGGCCSHGK